jgi:hypothetical protein
MEGMQATMLNQVHEWILKITLHLNLFEDAGVCMLSPLLTSCHSLCYDVEHLSHAK